MIEMRWLERTEKYIVPLTTVYEDRDKGVECQRTVTTLQYRYCEPCSSHGQYHDEFTDWSEWEDVPTVTD